MEHSIDSASARSIAVRMGWLWLVAFVIPLAGCTFFEGQSDRSASEEAAALAIANRVFSQGRLMPASGVVRIGAAPGDRVEAILVKAGTQVFRGQELVQLASFTGKQAELEIARRRLQEAMEQRVAKGTELEMVLATAQADQEAATAKVQFAKDQRSLVDQGSQTIESLRQQVDRLRQLTEDPLTKPLVGTLQLEQQKAQLLQEELRWNSSVAEADQSIAAAELAVKLATQRTANAQKNLQLADSLVPVRSLEAQVKSLEEQLERLRVTAPSSGEVLWVGSEPGELVGQMPLMEIADLSQMVCVAEVHESDRARLRIGQAAAIRSAALSKPLVGKIERIDRLVGSPMMRDPNPLARTDYRAVPVRIRLEPADAAAAAELVQLQVDVEITTTP